MIYRTVSIFKRSVRTWPKDPLDSHDGEYHIERVQRAKWWFLFIPILTYDTIIATNL